MRVKIYAVRMNVLKALITHTVLQAPGSLLLNCPKEEREVMLGNNPLLTVLLFPKVVEADNIQFAACYGPLPPNYEFTAPLLPISLASS